MSFGKLWLSAVLAEGKAGALLEHGPIDHLFKASEEHVFGFVKGFTQQYGSLPQQETVEAHTGETLPEAPEPRGYYYDLLVERHVELVLKKSLKEAQAKLGVDGKDPEKALSLVKDVVVSLLAQKNEQHMLDFRKAESLLWADYKSKWSGADDTGLFLGWPYLDKMSGGLRVGDLVSFVGRPAMGKTWQLLYAAMHGWQNPPEGQEPQSRLFISMEMAVLPIMQRLASLYTHLPHKLIKDGGFQTAFGATSLGKYKEGLAALEGEKAPFWVLDGNLATSTDEIEMLVHQLKPHAVFIDGGYLVPNATERDRYRRIAENSNAFKKRIAKLAPTVVSWQFARSAAEKTKKNKADQIGLEDIFGSDAIAQDSSLVLGLFEDDSVQTVKQRRIEILKGRNGETGAFTTSWNFQLMDFAEVVPVAIETLQIS